MARVEKAGGAAPNRSQAGAKKAVSPAASRAAKAPAAARDKAKADGHGANGAARQAGKPPVVKGKPEAVAKAAPAKRPPQKAPAPAPAKSAAPRPAAKAAAPAGPVVKGTAAKTPAAKAPASKAAVTKVPPAKAAAPPKDAPVKDAPVKDASVKEAAVKAAAAKAPVPAKDAPGKEPAAKVAAASKQAAPVKAGATAKEAGGGNGAAPAKAAPRKEPPRRTPGGDKFFAEQRQLLLEERATHMRQAESLKEEADALAAEMEPGESEFGEEGGEGGNLSIERELDLVLSAQAKAAVDEIDRALAKIEAGTYGLCEKCGKEIPRARLKALPHAPLCVACKSGGLSRR